MIKKKAVKRKTTFAQARKTMQKAFKKDGDLLHGYVANVGMRLYDLQCATPKQKFLLHRRTTRECLARAIVDLIFDTGDKSLV